nr:class I SAM-dependent methyltransferase [Acidobacteriota bacterium]
MKDYTAETYGETCADVYDDWHDGLDEATVPALSELARGGRVLELGVGTGRVAIPLASAGVEVHGIDASPAMVEKMRAKPGGERVPASIGNFADVAAEGEFSLVFVVFNTFFMLLTQEEQVRCFRNVAARLAPGGLFLLEAFVPDLSRYGEGHPPKIVSVTNERVTLDASQLDAARQHVTSQKVVLTDGAVRLYPIQIRYAWPSELDLMAQLAGLRLRERWAGWRRESFDSRSVKH